MADQAPQNYANHAKFVPLFHFVLAPMLLVNLIWCSYRLWFFLIQGHDRGPTGFAFLIAVALILLFFHARVFAMGVQDRVIRLEETMRMQRLLPENLRSRIPEFTIAQFVSLRFASDAELPELAAKVLNDKITDRKAIKQMIKNWRPDYCRA